MSRTARERGRTPALPSVEKVEVPQDHLGRRIALFALCLAVAIGSFGYGIYSWLGVDPGWTTVDGGGQAGTENLTFEFLVTEDGLDGRNQLRTVQGMYAQLCSQAYQLFNADAAPADENICNMWYINAHPNEIIEVDAVLYKAFEQMAEAKNRRVYLGPAYEVYTDLFYAQDADEAKLLDPWQDPEMEKFCQEIADFAGDPEQVNVELLGDNRLRLHVSEEYQRYMGESGARKYVDFYRQRNAFIVDYLIEEMTEAGLQAGVVSSRDGYTRSLPGTRYNATVNLADWNGQQAVAAAQISFDQPVSIAYLRAFPLGQEDANWYQDMGDGEFRHPYIDDADGKCKASANAVGIYSLDAACVQLMLAAEEAFISDVFEPRKLAEFDAVFLRDKTIFCTDPDLQLVNVYNGYTQKNV